MAEQNEMRHGKRKRAFTQVDNEIVNNSALSFQAKGMLLYLLSKPDGWKFYEDDLVKRSSNGKTSVRSTIKELLEVGYLIRGERFRDEKGHLKGYSYIVEPYLLDDYDGKSYITFSKVGKSKVGNSNLGNPYVGKSQRSNTKGLSNTKSLSNTEKDNKTKEQSDSSLSSQVFKFYESEYGSLTPYIAEEIEYMIKDLNEELVLEAMKASVLANKRTIKYTAAIVRNWKAENIKTLADLQAHEKMKERGMNGTPKQSNEPARVYDDGVNF